MRLSDGESDTQNNNELLSDQEESKEQWQFLETPNEVTK